jgi:hypothetical protein
MITSVLGRDVAAALRHFQALQPLGQLNLVYGVWAEVLAALVQVQDAQASASTPEAGLDQGVARVVEALSTWQAAGSGAGYAGLLVLQAEVCARAGQPQMGLDALDRALAWIERTGGRPMEADVWRMRGELLLALTPDPSVANGRAEEAEACFRTALAVAREQGSRWWELRAAASLARLWQARGWRDAGRELLAGIYDWFTEGFDTVDLVETKALLEELG